MPTSPESDSAATVGWRRRWGAVAGLLSAGMIAVGVLLLLLKVFAPAVWGGQGITRAQGPAWWRVGVQLGIGVVGECARLLAGRRSLILSGLVILGSLAALWAVWWR